MPKKNRIVIDPKIMGGKPVIKGIRVLDHIIMTKKGHFSFQESGLIKD